MDLDPVKIMSVLDDRIGRRKVQGLLALGCIAFAAWAIDIIYKKIGKPLYDFLKDLPPQIITLDNIEAVLLTLFAVVVILGGAIVLILYFLVRTLGKQKIPQIALNELARLRADGINSIFTMTPVDDKKFDEWETKYREWEGRVKNHLENYFPEADLLRFSNLGPVERISFERRLVFNQEHQRLMEYLVKQFNILEELLATYRRQ